VGRFHKGFAEEAVRIAVRIWQEIANWPKQDIKEVILSGHSLGGAVAAICEPLLWWRLANRCQQTQSVILGAPRYCDVAAQYSQLNFPIQIKRSGDMVPTIPPRALGYADCPWEFILYKTTHAIIFFGGGVFSLRSSLDRTPLSFIDVS
jgi:predicted lipase